MRSVFRAIPLAAAALALAAPAGAEAGDWTSLLADVFSGPAKQDDFRWQGSVPAGRRLEIKGVNGAIRAEAASGGQVELVATRRGRRQDPSTVEIKVLEHSDGVTICAMYPTPAGKKPNECAPGEGGRMSVNNNDVSVDFAVRVPAGVHLDASTVNGQVSVEGLSGNVKGTTVNGSVNIDTTGWALAETVNGSISASMGRTDWPGDAHFETVNGSITLGLPATASADVQAEVVNGRITTDFPLATQRAGRRFLSGRMGEGGRKLTLETVNGGIALDRNAR